MLPSIQELTIANMCWSGIDIELFTIQNIKQHQIPATFPAVNDSILNKIRQKAQQELKSNMADNQTSKKRKKKRKQRQKNTKPSSGVDSSQSGEMKPLRNRQQQKRKRLRYHDFDAIQ